ncbi:hypothetical protein P167DRAFT_368745 [Morchella conica CCBAS932]|uniref:Secreted protein n=1 Tax=Morchella conica CCBAS932 TaxID=1392247 RepID=A0A3N4KBY2_9PEZI|nr:hypothetical protein P167DRAFT_368745 [Morchella conica CCBAS932]
MQALKCQSLLTLLSSLSMTASCACATTDNNYMYFSISHLLWYYDKSRHLRPVCSGSTPPKHRAVHVSPDLSCQGIKYMYMYLLRSTHAYVLYVEYMYSLTLTCAGRLHK